MSGYTNKVGTFRFNDALSAASTAFWAEIAKQFPECKHGDFPIDATIQWDEQVGRFLTIWLDCNHPSSIGDKS